MQAVRLTQTMAGRGDLSPVYAPNGLSIAFSSDRAGNEDVYMFSLTTKTVTAVTNNPARDFQPAFAPDGTAVVYVSTRTGATEVFAQNLIGLTPGPAPAVQMTFDGLIKSTPAGVQQRRIPDRLVPQRRLPSRGQRLGLRPQRRVSNAGGSTRDPRAAASSRGSRVYFRFNVCRG